MKFPVFLFPISTPDFPVYSVPNKSFINFDRDKLIFMGIRVQSWRKLAVTAQRVGRQEEGWFPTKDHPEGIGRIDAKDHAVVKHFVPPTQSPVGYPGFGLCMCRKFMRQLENVMESDILGRGHWLFVSCTRKSTTNEESLWGMVYVSSFQGEQIAEGIVREAPETCQKSDWRCNVRGRCP